MHKFRTPEDVAAFVDGVIQAKGDLADATDELVSGTTLEVQPEPVDTERSVDVAKVTWARVEARIRAGAKSHLSPLHGVRNVSVVDGVLSMFRLRYLQGISKYGTPLKSHNGRNALADAAQEMYDGVLYGVQAQIEEESVGHHDLSLQRAIDHAIAALVLFSVCADTDLVAHKVGRKKVKVPREEIEAPEAVADEKGRSLFEEIRIPSPKVQKD